MTSTTKSNRPVCVRIAPSPTGDPHIGTAYIGLFNYVFAKSMGGKFVLRIEDTDQNRFRRDSEALIMECLKWTGLSWDEGPDVGGPNGPYRQSERTAIYQKWVHELLELKKAYRCFCTPQRLDELRKTQLASKMSLGYDRHCRRLSEDDVATKLRANESFTVRMMMPLGGKTVVADRLRGNVEFDNEGVDDQILMKSDGFPTYHLANVVDDHLMGVTHVIRGEEWLSSTPKHVVLYDSFGWEKPEFIHLPLLRNADKSKISKRKNPTSILYYRRKGILPKALLNFLALMGWNFGDDREQFSMEDMISGFTWDRFTLGGPVFDLKKLSWLNGQYMRQMTDDAYLNLLKKEVFSDDYLMRIVPLIKERIEKFEDFIPATNFFFSGDLTNYDVTTLVPKGKTNEFTAEVLSDIMDRWEAMDGWTVQGLHDVADGYLKEKSLKPKDVFMPVRIAITGTKESPPLFETVEVLGKEIVRRRMRLAIDFLKTVGQ